jgi:hypothetical protein
MDRHIILWLVIRSKTRCASGRTSTHHYDHYVVELLDVLDSGSTDNQFKFKQAENAIRQKQRGT